MSENESYHQQLFSSLSALKEGKTSLFQTSLRKARSLRSRATRPHDRLTGPSLLCRLSVVRELYNVGVESGCGLYPHLARLQALLELEDVGRATHDKG